MTTEKQKSANRENAKLSTGPRTDEGKHRISRNGLRHGLVSTVSVIPGESQADYDKHLSNFQDMFWPSNPFEYALVRQMADAEWRLRRISRLQAAALSASVAESRDHHKKYNSDKPEPDQEHILGEIANNQAADIGHYARYETQLQRSFMNAYNQLMAFRDRLNHDRQLACAQKELDRDPSEPSPYRRVTPITSPFFREDAGEVQENTNQSQSRITPKKSTTSDPPGSNNSDENIA